MTTTEVFGMYKKFVEDQHEQKKLTRLSIMTLLLDTISNDMGKFGWVRKGKGSVTDSMVDSGIMKFDFVKVYNGENVISTINININDDYDYGFNQIIVKGSKPINLYHWSVRSNGSYSFPDYNPNTTRTPFLMGTILSEIDSIYNV